MTLNTALISTWTTISLSAVLTLFAASTHAAPACSQTYRNTNIPGQQVVVTAALEKYLDINKDYVGPELIKKHNGSPTWAYLKGRIYDKDLAPLISTIGTNIRDVLDIGGGIGAFEAQLHHHLKQKTQSLTVVDKTTREVDGHTFSMKTLVEEFWQANGIPKKAARFLEVGTPETEKALSEKQYDLVVSFRALSFLFPYEWYGSYIKSNLKIGGFLVLDIKKVGSEFDKNCDADIHARFGPNPKTHTEVIQMLEQELGPAKVISDNPNSTRVIVQRTH